jgi:hypothetical protein
MKIFSVFLVAFLLCIIWSPAKADCSAEAARVDPFERHVLYIGNEKPMLSMLLTSVTEHQDCRTHLSVGSKTWIDETTDQAFDVLGLATGYLDARQLKQTRRWAADGAGLILDLCGVNRKMNADERSRASEIQIFIGQVMSNFPDMPRTPNCFGASTIHCRRAYV